MRATNITATGLDPSDLVYIPPRLVGADQLLREGDILITMSSGSASVVGRSVSIDAPIGASFGAFCGVLRAHDVESARYLKYMCASPLVRSQWADAARGVNINNLKRGDVLNTEVPFPSSAEQRRIVALLDEATQHIADLESAYAQTAALWTDFETAEMSSILEALDCPWLRLGECCEILDSLRRPITKRDRRPGPFPYFGATGEVDRVAEYLFDEPLVLLGEDGAKWDRGQKSAFSVEGKCWVNNHAHVLRPLRDVVLDDWLVAYLCHADLSEFITGLTVPKLNQARMREIPIPVPPLDEQEALVARLGVVGEIVARGRVGSDLRLRHLADLRQSVLESAFRGEL
jgi:restriction endonuclease S subunit